MLPKLPSNDMVISSAGLLTCCMSEAEDEHAITRAISEINCKADDCNRCIVCKMLRQRNHKYYSELQVMLTDSVA